MTTENNEDETSMRDIFLNLDSRSSKAKWTAAQLDNGNVMLRRNSTFFNSI
ncbi:hypothetical protein MS5380_51220 [Klebsiella pneumoniae]|nr:hypothetical protein Kpn21f22_16170 [Klebsiella pneumoniae]BDS98945.1 hypothetical protein Kpn21rf22_16140 [Klebsiella pneumoniae]GKM98103.1 hypothetical protein MS5232_43310 [Klebsiella pneumoniae]GKN21560.1 hypothetical protein MS5380_51220 [Klebsiella pneumoniae]